MSNFTICPTGFGRGVKKMNKQHIVHWDKTVALNHFCMIIKTQCIRHFWSCQKSLHKKAVPQSVTLDTQYFVHRKWGGFLEIWRQKRMLKERWPDKLYFWVLFSSLIGQTTRQGCLILLLYNLLAVNHVNGSRFAVGGRQMWANWSPICPKLGAVSSRCFKIVPNSSNLQVTPWLPPGARCHLEVGGGPWPSNPDLHNHNQADWPDQGSHHLHLLSTGRKRTAENKTDITNLKPTKPKGN